MRRLLLTSFLVLLLATAGEAASFRELLDARTANVWVEGQVLGDMILGARARLSFILVDGALSRNLAGSSEAPEWLAWHGQHYGAKGKTLFVVRLKVLKPWTFDPTELRVGSHRVALEDIRARVHYLPEGDLPSDFEAAIALQIPTKALPTGPIFLGYGEYGTEWTAPK